MMLAGSNEWNRPITVTITPEHRLAFEKSAVVLRS